MSLFSTFGHPNRVEFGQGVAETIGERLVSFRITKVFLVTHPILTELDSYKNVEAVSIGGMLAVISGSTNVILGSADHPEQETLMLRLVSVITA